MADVLEEILFARKNHVKEARERVPLAELERLAKAAPLPVNFFSGIVRDGGISVIAEIKKKSPSAGLIREIYDVGEIASAYEEGGASALSVLTEPEKFGGGIGDIKKARAASRLPILRKDFIFDPYQIVEGRAYGADAVLLIAEMLSPSQLKELTVCAKEYLLEPLVEVYSTASVPAAINSGARLIGINTRNLRTLEMNSGNVVYLSKFIPRDRKIVAESGIKTEKEMEVLKAVKVAAILVGESLLKQANLKEAVQKLVQAGKFQ